jgi:hypothetical protein
MIQNENGAFEQTATDIHSIPSFTIEGFLFHALINIEDIDEDTKERKIDTVDRYAMRLRKRKVHK